MLEGRISGLGHAEQFIQRRTNRRFTALSLDADGTGLSFERSISGIAKKKDKNAEALDATPVRHFDAKVVRRVEINKSFEKQNFITDNG